MKFTFTGKVYERQETVDGHYRWVPVKQKKQRKRKAKARPMIPEVKRTIIVEGLELLAIEFIQKKEYCHCGKMANVWVHKDGKRQPWCGECKQFGKFLKVADFRSVGEASIKMQQQATKEVQKEDLKVKKATFATDYYRRMLDRQMEAELRNPVPEPDPWVVERMEEPPHDWIAAAATTTRTTQRTN